MTTEYLSMQEVKAAELRLLRIFDCYCRENICDIQWVPALFSVRLGTRFIPWDDDIDVVMPVEDYRKFLAGFAPVLERSNPMLGLPVS